MVHGLLALGLTAWAAGGDIEALERLWSGAHDSREEVTVSSARSSSPLPEVGGERRVRTIVAPVDLPWLGAHGLYLEEFPHDEPDRLRRQLLVKLEPAGTGAHEIRARLYTFVDPERWTHLERRPRLLAELRPTDVRAFAGCDLLLVRTGEQFEGSTAGQRCVTPDGAYVDYQLMIGAGLYWYRRRLIGRNDGALREEVVGYNWFELNEARLFSCRIDWSPTGRARDLRPLERMDLQDKGGTGLLVTPDGRHLQLTLHSQDWPYAAEHDALVLLLSRPGESIPLAVSWAVVDQDRIALRLRWLRVRCGSLEPSTDRVQG